jgi:hypothetical protein
MNLVERYFRDLSQQAILPGSFGSMRQLVDAIMKHLAQHNFNPKGYVWRAKGEEILAKIQRAWKAALGENKDVTIYFRDSALVEIVSTLLNIEILVTLPNGQRRSAGEKFVSQDLGQENVFGHVFGFRRVFEKSHTGAIRLSVRRIDARSIIASEVCTRYS